jgi:hypothetical protein
MLPKTPEQKTSFICNLIIVPSLLIIASMSWSYMEIVLNLHTLEIAIILYLSFGLFLKFATPKIIEQVYNHFKNKQKILIKNKIKQQDSI